MDGYARILVGVIRMQLLPDLVKTRINFDRIHVSRAHREGNRYIGPLAGSYDEDVFGFRLHPFVGGEVDRLCCFSVCDSRDRLMRNVVDVDSDLMGSLYERNLVIRRPTITRNE